MAALGAMYALLQNGHWTPGNDSELYLTLARNLAAGRGYVFNGQPFGHYPPGWPALLALVMSVSRSFWVLNALAKALLLGAAAFCYLAMLRFTTPRRAAVCVFLSATLWFWFRFSYVLYSESLFLFLTSLGLLLALQVSEGRTQPWRIGALAVVCAAMATTRWLGLVAAGVMALTAVSGRARPLPGRRWLAFASVVVAAGCVFVLWYVGTAEGLLADADAGWLLEDVADAGMPDAHWPQKMESRLRRIPLLSWRGVPLLAARVAGAGAWICRMLWPAAQLGSSDLRIAIVVDVVGTVLWLFVAVFAWQRLKRREWLWLGMLLYAGFLVVRWRPRGRYLVPFAPFWILAVWVGAERLFGWLGRGGSRFWRAAAFWVPRCLLAVVLVSNLCVYSVASWVQRSGDFYATFRAGQCRQLVEAGHYVAHNTPPGAPVAVSLLAQNLGRTRKSRGGLSAMALLTDRPLVPFTPADGAPWPDPDFVEWARGAGISYVLYRPPTSPWRLWHFRAPWLQRLITGQRDIPTNPYWVLYRVEGDRLVPVQTPRVSGWPDRVPPVAR
jgi:hypothetical protein